MAISNLPLPTQTEVEDAVKFQIDQWTPRARYTALGYLYKLCDCKIDDLPWKISLALEAEKEARL